MRSLRSPPNLDSISNLSECGATCQRELRIGNGADLSTDSSASGYCRVGSMEPLPVEVHDLLAVREALSDRIGQRRLGLRSALQVLGGTLADALADAPCSTVQLFFDANEHG